MRSAERCAYCGFILLLLAFFMWIWPGGNPALRAAAWAVAQFLLSGFYVLHARAQRVS